MEIADENYWIEKSLELLELLDNDDGIPTGDPRKLSDTERTETIRRINAYNLVIEAFRSEDERQYTENHDSDDDFYVVDDNDD